MRENRFRHSRSRRDLYKALWKPVGKAAGYKAGSCRHAQISKMISMEDCNQAVVDFPATTEVSEFPPTSTGRMEQAQGSGAAVQVIGLYLPFFPSVFLSFSHSRICLSFVNEDEE